MMGPDEFSSRDVSRFLGSQSRKGSSSSRQSLPSLAHDTTSRHVAEAGDFSKIFLSMAAGSRKLAKKKSRCAILTFSTAWASCDDNHSLSGFIPNSETFSVEDSRFIFSDEGARQHVPKISPPPHQVETLIPMLLQRVETLGTKKASASTSSSRLKRVVLIGDHHQLPPVVKNRAFQKFGNLDQPLFTRFIRLNVPHITLDAQGRARPSIAELYSWRYEQKLSGSVQAVDNKALADLRPADRVVSVGMKNLPMVCSKIEYRLANTGFVYEYQFIDVGSYQGRDETAPTPFFYQNEGEAEMVVATFMLMRLLGYPGEKISILTTYNGQKALLRDVITKRCGWNPLYGWPKQVTTVDMYQGQQNE